MKQRRVISFVVAAGDGGQRIEPLDQHALRIQIAEAVRTGYFPAALGGKPFFQSSNQGAGHLRIILAFKPSEAPALISQLAGFQRMDDAAHPTHQPFAAPPQQQLDF
jgi:hypothetical protein